MTGAPGWYVVQALPLKERFVRDRIADLGRESFLPLVSERRPGARRSRLNPLFPGYLFANLDPREGDLASVRWLVGVRRVLGDRDRPRPIDDAVVATLRARTDRDGRVRFGTQLRRGDKVRILDGPFAGFVGVLERVAHDPQQRVCVLLDLFHRLTCVEVDAQAVIGHASR